MNTSFKESGDPQGIGMWFRKHNYPHCKAVNNLSSLRSGVAIAEILSEKLPRAYHSLFLPNIEIYNLNPQRAMLNLKVMLNTLKAVIGEDHESEVHLDDFTPEGLYFDHNMMEAFITNILIPLKVTEDEAATIQEIVREHHQALQDISDIANISCIVAHHHEPKALTVEKVSFKQEGKQVVEKKSEIDQQQLRIEGICDWLEAQHRIIVEQQSPEEIMGELVNSVFAGSRLDKQKIVKKSHYEQGSTTVFKKSGQYLLTCERMPKHNVLAMLQEVELGCMRQQLFWNVIEDIMNIKASHLKKMRRKSTKKSITRANSKKTITQTEEDKQNNVYIQNAKNKDENHKKPIIQTYHCNSEIIRMAQKWIGSDLGYEYSLNKSKNSVKKEQNPLLNGVLLGSIVMRMQLGKVWTNKEPKGRVEIDKNMKQVINCILHRGLEAGRMFSKVKPSYQTYVSIIWEVKCQLQKKMCQEKVRRAAIQKQRLEMQKLISSEQKQMIVNWLRSREIVLQSNIQVPASVVSEVCSDILELRLLRETTKRIRETNMGKIVSELRRLGWQGEGDYREVLDEESNEMRWSIMKFCHDLTRNKIYYYRG